MSLLDAIAVIAALTLGATVQSAVGFGVAVVAAPLIALIDVALLPLVVTPVGLVTNVAVLRRDGGNADATIVRWLLVGAVIGTIVAVPLLAMEDAARRVLVAVIAASGALGLGLRVPSTRHTVPIAGLLSGIGGLLAGINGPQVLPVVPRDDPARFRGTLAVFFLAITPIQIGVLVFSDLPLLRSLGTGVLAIPAVLGGIAAGHRLTRVAKPVHVKVAVLVLAVVAAAGPVADALG